jgi:uncharacterized protein
MTAPFLPVFSLLVLLFFQPVYGTAQKVRPAPEVPAASGYVNDLAAILSADTRMELERFLREFDRTDSTQVVVLTIPSLEGASLEEFSLRVVEAWKPGQKNRDNGALILVVSDDRMIRIEAGKGLEGTLTDLVAGRIIDYEMAPRFRQGDFNGGVTAAVNAVVNVVRGEYRAEASSGADRERNPWGLLILAFLLLPFLLRVTPPSSRGGRHWPGGPIGGGRIGRGGGFSGGGFGGGGFSGGGGGFGGGGASGRW